MPKYKRPLAVIVWDEHPWIPRCCWLCSSFDRETAHCAKYDMDVPEDFAAKEDACSDWTDKDGVPF